MSVVALNGNFKPKTHFYCPLDEKLGLEVQIKTPYEGKAWKQKLKVCVLTKEIVKSGHIYSDAKCSCLTLISKKLKVW